VRFPLVRLMFITTAGGVDLTALGQHMCAIMFVPSYPPGGMPGLRSGTATMAA